MKKRWTFGKQIAILLIEEDPREQASFKNFFNARADRYKYTISAGVNHALRQIKENTFDVIISDISFIDGNVFDLLPHTEGIPFIIITAKGDEEIAVKVTQRGAAVYVLRDVERKYLQTLPSLILRSARQSRGKMLMDILSKALLSIDECLCVFTTDRQIIFANRSFCNVFRLKNFYYRVNVNTILKNFKISGEPCIDTFLNEEIREEISYEIRDANEDRKGKIRVIPVTGTGGGIIGYVMIGACYANEKT